MYQDYVQYYIMVNDNNNNNHHHHHHHDHHVDIHPFIIFMLFYIYIIIICIIYIYICIMYIYTLYYSKILHPVQIFITPNDLPERCWMSTFPIGGWFLCWSNYFQKSLFGVSYSLLFGFVLWWSHFFGHVLDIILPYGGILRIILIILHSYFHDLPCFLVHFYAFLVDIACVAQTKRDLVSLQENFGVSRRIQHGAEEPRLIIETLVVDHITLWKMVV